jgi:hypothetical protein
MAPYRKLKSPPRQPTAHRSIRIVGPKHVEEEEESSESDSDPDPQALARVNNAGFQEKDDGECSSDDDESSEESNHDQENEDDNDKEVSLSPPVLKNGNQGLL